LRVPNRLARESSLYLRQHADNPVDWHPWEEETLALARREARPILLSIGYSACHWCHVMAHESFEDEATARVMNALFVNIKVDREERPDLDKIYQLAHQALSRRGGGWPLTVFLSPEDLVPFYAGTYFPPQPRHGLPSFVEVLRGVRRWYDEHPAELLEQTAALGEFLAHHGRESRRDARLDDAPVAEARRRIEAAFDPAHGGHRGGPKFPPATEIELLQRLARDGDSAADAMADLTLRRMAERGLHDHVGGGFFRYCVDAHWGIPHFEKMLYDNAALLGLYAEAGTRGGEAEFLDAADGIVGWLQRDMLLPGGGFASALDADSEGEEGRYYLWTRDEAAAVLDEDPAERDAFFACYGLADAPNFEDHAWHLQRSAPLTSRERFAAARQRLRRVRDERVPPARDDKRLTAWNAMLVRALARGAIRLDRPHWLDLAEGALAALRAHAWRDGRLLAVASTESRAIPGFLDDHAFLLDALLERLQARWRDADAQWARELAERLLAEFEDRELGGFFFTPQTHEPLPQRPKPWFDESVPAGNAVAARALLRLGHLFGEPRWLEAAERTLQAGGAALEDAPHGACALVAALHEYRHPTPLVVVRCAPKECLLWAGVLRGARRDGSLVVELPPESGWLADKPHVAGGIAYVCIGMRCLAPVTTPDDLPGALASARSIVAG
jgi:uncharacterized protein YyaL (SSP411 family)